jgi:hypothetical protein
MKNEEYFSIAANVFLVPDNPGASPEFVVGMKAAVVAELTRLTKLVNRTPVPHVK